MLRLAAIEFSDWVKQDDFRSSLHTEYSMTVSNQEFVGKALTLLRDGLFPFIERECAAVYGDRWRSRFREALEGTRLVNGSSDPVHDVAAQLAFMDRKWGEVFRTTLGRGERSLVNELMPVRNQWAHQNPFPDEDADRALDSVLRLLTAISALQADLARTLRNDFRKCRGNAPTFGDKRATKFIDDRAVPAVRGGQSTLRDQILEYVARFPGRDDDEIAAALSIHPRQNVNAICRNLAKEGILRRERGPQRGKIVNFTIDDTAPLSAIAARSVPEKVSNTISEDKVKSALEAMLKSDGWSVKIAWGRARGVDIEATRAKERWIIECKGEGSLAPMQNNYFVGVIGELTQRMTDVGAKHSIAFPDRPKFRRLWQELPTPAKQRLQLSALFVSDDGSVAELST